MASEDFVYEHAPLIEVITEVRWELTNIQALPGAAVDPYFSLLAETFQAKTASLGYSHVEKLVPDGVPMEFMAWQPVWRYRKQADKWPLYQIGPGLFTCNIIPVYEGWSEFKKVLEKGLDALCESFPSPEKFMKISGLEVRYIDGFTKVHGLKNYEEFVSSELGIKVEMPQGFVEAFSDEPNKKISTVGTKIKLKKPSNADGIIKIASGQKNSEEAVIVELRVRGVSPQISSKKESVIAWMDEAHLTLRDIFESMTSEQLKERMGPKRPVKP